MFHNITRQKVLRLVLDSVGIDAAGKVRITLAIPAPEFMSIVSQRRRESNCLESQELRA